MFANMLGVIEAAARLDAFATKGAIQKMNLHMTVGQVGRALLALEKEGYIGHYTVKHGRTGKMVWYTTTKCETNMGIVSAAVIRAGVAKNA